MSLGKGPSMVTTPLPRIRKPRLAVSLNKLKVRSMLFVPAGVYRPPFLPSEILVTSIIIVDYSTVVLMIIFVS